MVQRRRVGLLTAPMDPYQRGKAGLKDPRDFISGNDPGQQWDEQQFADDRADAYRADLPPIAEVVRRHQQGGVDGVVRTLPTRISYVRWRATGVSNSVPVLLVPRNPQRVAIQLSTSVLQVVPDLASTLFFSWGNPGPITGQPGEGHVLNVGQILTLTGDAVPIDDLWVWNVAFPTISYLAFEGIELPEANQ